MVESGSDIGVEIRNATNPTYTISNPIYNQNNTGYYCVAINNEGIAVSNTSTLIGNCIMFHFCCCMHVLSSLLWQYDIVNTMLAYIWTWKIQKLYNWELHLKT